MTLLVPVIIVVIVAFLLIYAVDQVQDMKPPFPVILKVLIILVAVLIILNRAGLL